MVGKVGGSDREARLPLPRALQPASSCAIQLAYPLVAGEVFDSGGHAPAQYLVGVAGGRWPGRQRCPVPLVRVHGVRTDVAEHAFRARFARLLGFWREARRTAEHRGCGGAAELRVFSRALRAAAGLARSRDFRSVRAHLGRGPGAGEPAVRAPGSGLRPVCRIHFGGILACMRHGRN